MPERRWRVLGRGRVLDRSGTMFENAPERRWRVAGRGRGLFAIEVDDGVGFRAATTAEVDAALRQRELFGAAEYSVRHVGSDDRDDVDVGGVRGVSASVPEPRFDMFLVPGGQ